MNATSADTTVPGTTERFQLSPALLKPLPKTPSDAASRNQQMTKRITRWDRHAALSALALLQLDPRLHVHSVRLYWASRLVAGLATGSMRPSRTDLLRFLNTDLGKSDVTRLEDPSEDLFAQSVPTRHGNRRLLWLRGTYDDIVGLQKPYDPAKMTVRGPVFPTRSKER